jgi:hypothetical protein
MHTLRRFVLSLVFCLCGAGALRADDLTFQGFVDVRLVVPPGEESWVKGGLGKLRFGSSDAGLTGRFVEAIGEADWQIVPALTTVLVARVEPNQRTGVDALEAYARYSPEAIGQFRWSLKAGAFFLPVSLENDDLGWTSPYTLTPSAIDSWIGDEFRPMGVEADVAWQTRVGTITALGSVFCCNDPAGALIAERGWSMDDRPTGLFEEPHEPNESLALFGRDFPDRVPMFREFDNRAEWYAGATWDVPGIGRAQFLYFDNDANPYAHDTDYFAWHTQFWSAGLSTRISDVALLFQSLGGSTQSAEFSSSVWKTDFWSTYALASYDLGDWRFSLRGDLFGTGQGNVVQWEPFAEQGRAVTAAVSWMPRDWLRLTAELVSLDAQRQERVSAGLPLREYDNQFQLSLRASI